MAKKICFQQKLGSTNTADALTIYLYNIITNWMDTGMALADKFPNKYSRAILSQYAIGWDNFFCGKISQEWLLLYDESRTNSDDTQCYSAQYIWGVYIIEIMLHYMIMLWNIRYKQVHRITDSKQQRFMENCQITTFKR